MEQLAARCAAVGAPELTKTVIHAVETGRRDAHGWRRRNISVDELTAFAAVFGVPAADLLEGAGTSGARFAGALLGALGQREVRAAIRGAVQDQADEERRVMQHIGSYARAQWEAGETDYQKAARSFLQDVLEAEDPSAFLWLPVSEKMCSEFARLRRAHIEALPVPAITSGSREGAPGLAALPPGAAVGEAGGARAVQDGNDSQWSHGGAGVLPASEDLPGDGAHARNESHKTDGTVPGEQDLAGHGTQTPHESQHSHGAVPCEQDTSIPEADDVHAATPTPLEQRMEQLRTEVFIKGKGYIPWEEVTLEDAVATILWSQAIIRGIQVNSRKLEIAVALMKRHKVRSVGDLPMDDAARIFARMS